MPPRKKTPAKKTGLHPSVQESKAPQPMDPSVQESITPKPQRNRERNGYAMQTLIDEMVDLFPDLPYETSEPREFNVRTLVTFKEPHLSALLLLIQGDPRVADVRPDPEAGETSVEFHASLRTQDSRDPFGLAEAYAILAEDGKIALDENHDFVIEKGETDG